MNDQKPGPGHGAEDGDHRLDAVIAQYLQARDEGRPIDRRALLAQHPDLADELTRFFDGNDRVEWLVTSVVPVATKEGAWFGPYRVTRMISRGGMGVVYEAEDPATARRVALKVLPTLGLPDPRDQERFRREIELAARLNHPHIVSILDFGTVGGILYCAMELIEGQDLRTLIRSLRRAGRESSFDGAGAAVLQAVRPAELVQAPGTWPQYFQFVARVGADAAVALEYAHSQGIWHRDIKPSNVLLDVNGRIHVADFGLAKAAENPDLTETGDLAGTLRYLAPERLNGLCGPWSDVYSLGVTLYELLVLRPAFETLDRSQLIRSIARESPKRPRAINRAVPRDLETIVRRAIEKEPAHRYPTAAALADDLERFMTDRPILGRPAATWRRTWAWSRRNPGTAATLASGALVLVVAVGAILFGLMMSRSAALARAATAQAQRAAAETTERESTYQSLVLQSQQIRLLPHRSGWSERAWDLVQQAKVLRGDTDLRDQAAATLAGVDARLSKEFRGIGASSVAFDREGKRLLIGGIERGQNRDARAKILDLTSNQPPVPCGLPGPGPVTFRDDGTPVQLVVGPEGGLVLWDLGRRQAFARFDLAQGATPGCLALRPDGSAIAASVTQADRRNMVLVWDVDQSRLRHQFARKATALVFSDNGELLAVGDEDGRISVWKLQNGERIADVSQGRNTIHGFSFTRNPHQDVEGKQSWLLAAGDSGGSIVVWDLSTQLPISRCNGSPYNVYALAFSDDGTTLASAGRAIFLWDWATGRNLLDVPAGSPNSCLAFSRDGLRLAVGHHFLREPGHLNVFIWDLERGRGIRTLRGLTSPVRGVVFSPDERKIAALSHDWRLGIWDVASGRLEAILSAPKGFTADNAALAFSGDGRRFAACAGREAKLWDAASWKVLRTWPLPPGLVDRIAFPSSGQLLLFRYESRDGVHIPFGDDFKIDPNVCRIRNLLGPEPLNPVTEFPGFNRRIYQAPAVRDGRSFIVHGEHDSSDGQYYGIQALDGINRKDLWSIRWGREKGSGRLVIDHSGEYFLLRKGIKGRERSSLREASTGKEVRLLDNWPGFPGPDWKYFVHSEGPGVSLFNGDGRLLLKLAIDTEVASGLGKSLTSDGKRMAWGNNDGSLLVADLDEIRSRLAQAGLGW